MSNQTMTQRQLQHLSDLDRQIESLMDKIRENDYDATEEQNQQYEELTRQYNAIGSSIYPDW